jgi:hypothetical protein
MFGSIGFLAASGSRVLVPNIVGLTTSAASSALSAVGLVLGSSTGSTTSGANSGNNGYVASQSVSSGSYVNFGTTITYTTYSYTEPPPPPNPPVWTDSSIVNSFTAGSSYSDSVSATNGASYSFIQPDGNVYPYWVQGVTIDSGTGMITGTPTTAGQAYKFAIRASNAGGSVDSAVYQGTVSSTPGSLTSVEITFTPAYASTELQGNIKYTNNTGATYSISVSTSAGTISPTSFLVGGYSAPGSPTVVNQPFLVNGLSAGQQITVSASGGNASASASATTLSGSPPDPDPTYSYYFEYDLGQPMCVEFVDAQGNVTLSSGQTVSVNAGNCGSQSIYAFTNATFYWTCCRVEN